MRPGERTTDVATVHVLRHPAAGDFDDFPDREPARRAGDHFFASWVGEPPVVAAPPPAVRGRPRRGVVLGVVAALAVLVAVLVVAGRQQAGFTRQAGAAVAPRTVTLELDPPVEVGDSVELTWRSNADLEFAVVVAGEALPVDVVLVNRERTTRVPVESGRAYCFLVQGTDGAQVYQSAPRPIRGAECPR